LASVSDMATDGAAASPVPLEQRCVWPGCTRRRAPGRASGSGRQKEYCLLASSPADGGGPVHNARNRWAALRGADQRTVTGDGLADVDHAEGVMDGGETAGTVPEQFVLSIAKKRASVLLEQARRQHAAAVESLRAERELYQRLGEQLTVLTDPASLDLEIAAIASRAGRDVAQSAEEAARARRAQLAAERERDDAVLLRAHADGAAEQLAADAEAAEHALAERTAEFERDRAALLARVRDAERRASTATAESVAAKAAADTAVADAERSASAAREHAKDEIAAARAQAARDIAQARDQATEQIAAALARADELAAQARRQAAEAVTEARRETAAARADAERERGAAQQAREDAAAARQELRRELDAAQHRIAAAQTEAATANAHAGAAAAQEQRLQAEIERLRDESDRRDSEHLSELARLDAAHRTALDALRGHGNSGSGIG
jgi:colicin import membrane protein